MSDATFTYERANFAERAAKLAGGTTFREPVGGRSTKQDIPDEHAIAAAFAYSRVSPNDIGPDIAVAIITGCPAHGDRIVRELAAALMAGLGHRAKAKVADVIRVAADCYLRAVRGTGGKKPEGLDDRQYQIVSTLGDRILWQAAEESLFRAERAYRRSEMANRLQTACNLGSAKV